MKKVLSALTAVIIMVSAALAAAWLYGFKTLEIPVTLTTPATNIDGTPLTDLAGIDIYVRYQGETDWTFVKAIPESRAGVTLDATVTVPRQGIFELSVVARDDVSNASDFSPPSELAKAKTTRPSPGQVKIRAN